MYVTSETKTAFKSQFANFDDLEKFPVAKITYVVSLVIATNPEVRARLFENNHGPFLVITQFWLDHWQVGVFANGDILVDYLDSKNAFAAFRGLILINSFINIEFNSMIPFKLPFVVAWLVTLNPLDHGSSTDERYFSQYVQLTKVPFHSN